MNLASIELYATLKGDRTQPTDAVYVASVEARIKSVSANAERYMARKAQTGSYTEKFSPQLGSGTRFVQLSAYPVSSVSEVKVFDSAITSDDYTLDAENGILYFNAPIMRNFIAWHNAISVSYIGGMAADTASFVDAFPDISTEVCIQTAFELARQKTISEKSTANGPVSTTHNPYGMLDSLREVLDRHAIPKRIF